ncbi:MAG: MarR family transcriptional regulator [Gammaproteobacteria bacterium]|nr:MarR family transcriptional regulator [Gammaproteobacteria bacterium]
MTTDRITTADFVRLINDLHLGMARLFNHRVRDFGLTRAHWRVVSGLHRHDGLTQTELAQAIAMARSPLGKIIDKLEAEGWIERKPDPDDRRVNRLYLTKAIEPILEPAWRVAKDLEVSVLADLSPRTQTALKSNLATIRDVLNRELSDETG